jgi:predicted NBD/HSP70 family sugar kinase
MVFDLRHGDWRLGTCAVDDDIGVLATGHHEGARPDEILTALSARVRAAAGPLGNRLVGFGAAVPEPTADDRLAHATMLGWHDIDLSMLPPEPHLPFIAGNDSTMAAVAEARLHSPRTLLHVAVEIGIGGALVLDGRPVPSAHGLHGEFGHLPFGAPGDLCPCGALDCWATAGCSRDDRRGPAHERVRHHGTDPDVGDASDIHQGNRDVAMTEGEIAVSPAGILTPAVVSACAAAVLSWRLSFVIVFVVVVAAAAAVSATRLPDTGAPPSTRLADELDDHPPRSTLLTSSRWRAWSSS